METRRVGLMNQQASTPLRVRSVLQYIIGVCLVVDACIRRRIKYDSPMHRHDTSVTSPRLLVTNGWIGLSQGVGPIGNIYEQLNQALFVRNPGKSRRVFSGHYIYIIYENPPQPQYRRRNGHRHKYCTVLLILIVCFGMFYVLFCPMSMNISRRRRFLLHGQSNRWLHHDVIKMSLKRHPWRHDVDIVTPS